MKQLGQPQALQAGTDADEVYLSGEPLGEDGPHGRLQTDALAPCPGGKWVRTPAAAALHSLGRDSIGSPF